MTICNLNRINCVRLKTVLDHWHDDAEEDNETFVKLKKIACLNVCPLRIDVKQLSCADINSTTTPTTNLKSKEFDKLDNIKFRAPTVAQEILIFVHSFVYLFVNLSLHPVQVCLEHTIFTFLAQTRFRKYL